MFKIYGMHTPMYLKAVVAAEELGVAYQIISVDLTKGETKTAEHMSRHPFGKVPALEHNGKFLFESNAIIRYMADVSNSKLYPKDSFARATVDQWIDYFSLQAGRWVTSTWFTKCIGPKYFNEPMDEKLVADNNEALLEAMPVLDAHFAKNQFVAGAEFSLADINAYLTTIGWRDAQIPLGDFPHFVNWFDSMADRPAFKRILQGNRI